MPIYEYRCESCGHLLDALQKLGDAPLVDCPECEDPALKRLVSAPRFRLKGSGWYETDFKSEKERKRNLADSGDKAERADKPDSADKPESADKPKQGTSKDEKKSESKEKKPEAKPKDTPTKSGGGKGSGSEAA